MTRLSLLFLLLTACGKKSPPAPAATPAAPQAQAEATTPAPAAETWGADLAKNEVRVTLLEAGAEPREALRYTPPADERGGMRMSMDIDMAIDMGGLQIPMDMPAMIMDMDLAVSSIAPSGDITYTTEVVGVDLGESTLPEEVLAEVRSGLEELVGLTGTATMSSRGEVQAARYDQESPTEAVSQQITQLNRSAQSFSQPLPSEAVGVGARWEVLRRSESNGVEVADRAVVTLSAREGERLTLEIENTQRMLGDAVSLPDMPPGTEATVAYFKAGGSGTQVTELTSLLPVDGSSALELEMNVEMSGEGMNMSMGTEMTMSASVTRR